MNCLLVEDVKISQHICKASLSMANFIVDVAVDGAEAISMFSPGKYKFILMDIAMEGTSSCFLFA